MVALVLEALVDTSLRPDLNTEPDVPLSTSHLTITVVEDVCNGADKSLRFFLGLLGEGEVIKEQHEQLRVPPLFHRLWCDQASI